MVSFPNGMLDIREARAEDGDALWEILEPIVRGGEVFALPRDFSRKETLEFWSGSTSHTFVSEIAGRIVGTAYLKPNQLGGGSHVANAGFATALDARGSGVARALCALVLERARKAGFRAMQFNFVVSTNDHAIRLWKSFGFETVGILPAAYEHPSAGAVDAYIMFLVL